MPKAEQQDQDLEIEEVGDFEEGDYGFIVSPTGELKHVYLPEDFMLDPPKEVEKILKIFGIKDINQATPTDTLH